MNGQATQTNAKKAKGRFWLAGIALVLLLISFWVGVNVGYANSKELEAVTFLSDKNALPPEGVDFSALWKAWSLLQEKFVPVSDADPITDEKLLWGAIQGLAKAYGDPYTVFFPPAEAETFQEDIKGSFGGVGIEIGMRNSVLTVISPLKDSPAERAGVKSGDKILEIDGESTEGITIEKAVQTIRGEIGTPVKLTVAHEEGGIETVTVVRDEIRIPTIDTKLRDDGVFVIELYNFSAPSTSLFRNAYKEFLASDSHLLILDLRNNPGGFLESAVDIASLFLPEGKVVVTESFGEDIPPRIHRSKGSNIENKRSFDMVILVNEGSASASEIVAGALQEHGKALLVGKHTFGKGSVQELVPVTSDTSLKVTIARWLTPEGNSISDGGLKPDVEVEITPEDVSEGRDPQLEKAVQLLLAE